MKKVLVGLLILFTVAQSAFAQTTEPKGITGVWQGVLDVGGTKLRLVLTVKKNGDACTGTLDSLDQGSSIPIDSITVSGDTVRLELKSVAASYEGVLREDRSEIVGKFSQGGADLPLTFKPKDQSAAANTPAAPMPRPLDVPVDAVIPLPPTAFKSQGKTHLAYELHLTNFSRSEVALLSLEILSGDAQKKLLQRKESEALAADTVRPGVAGGAGVEKLKIGAGLRAVVFVWVAAFFEAPATLQHRFVFKVGSFPEEMSLEGVRVAVSKAPVVINPPLRGDGWLAGNGPSNTSGHRRALIPVGGAARIAQRFAIDFVQLREDGRTFTGDAKDNRNYRCYGAEALAVADATVVAVKDGIPENIPGINSRAVPITLETIGGNYVILDLGDGRYAFYAHLQPGKIRVKQGDKVRRGQTLGLVGNSGNSTEPHLHFHISDAGSPLGSEGLPYALTSFESQGKGWGWKPSDPKYTRIRRQMEMPLELEVVRFESK
jgi:murein DD-endopeptidase MepM/ murein hydrolase activator NlpD